MVLLSVLDVVLVVLGGAGMLYQAVCIVISLFAKPIKFPEAPMNKRYAVLISARNEANVIGNLIDCLHSQTYPSELIDIWLVADNCTDNTAEVARNMGCHVIERFNKEQVGKGYALTYLLDQMNESGASDPYDAFFVFDADNKLDKHYIEEMNKGFQAGFKILTSYRNSVNLSDNWVSSGSALWFIRESRSFPPPACGSATAATWAAPASCSPRRSCVATTAGNSTYSPRIWNSPWTACCTATASATAAPPSCTTSSRSPSRKAGVNACVGARASCRCSAITDRR